MSQADHRPPALRPFAPGDERAVESILRALPGWFGIEESLVQYVRYSAAMETWLAERDGRFNRDRLAARREVRQRTASDQPGQCAHQRKHDDDHKQLIGAERVAVGDDRAAKAGDRGEQLCHHHGDHGAPHRDRGWRTRQRSAAHRQIAEVISMPDVVTLDDEKATSGVSAPASPAKATQPDPRRASSSAAQPTNAPQMSTAASRPRHSAVR